jgi:2-alkenal reductase
VPFGDPEQLRVGQPVLAIGSPLGAFTNTVTQGIISALNRDFPDDAGLFYTNLVQHDAAINPGNSGGPLFNAAGEVIGVNTLGINQLPERGPVQGLFFAIPIDRVASVVAELIENGEVNYPALGIGGPFRSISEQVASQFDLRVDHGLYFTEVVAGGPADEAGMEGGDIILAINGEEIDADTAFSELLFAFEPGDTVTVTVQRGDEQLDFEVTLTSTAELDE